MPSHINISWSNEDFVNETFQGYSFVNCKFSNCDFNSCNFDDVELVNCRFTNCDFVNTDLSCISLINTSFVNCDSDNLSSDRFDVDESHEEDENFELPSSSHRVLEPVNEASIEMQASVEEDGTSESSTDVNAFNFGGTAFHREIT